MSKSKEQLIEISKLLYRNLESNIHQIQPLFHTTNEVHKFYYGIISRQLYFTSDISCLLSNQYVENLTSIFLISRSILDDFMPLHFVAHHQNEEEQITLLNADAHGMNFKKIRDLANLNQEILNNSFPYYPTQDTLKDLVTELLKNPDKSKYISDRNEPKFYRFLNKKDLIDTYKEKDSRADLYRCYFQWRHLSDYVHYSKFTYDYDIQNQTPKHQYDLILEVFIFAYFGCKIIVKRMKNDLDINHIEEKYFEETTIDYLNNINK